LDTWQITALFPVGGDVVRVLGDDEDEVGGVLWQLLFCGYDGVVVGDTARARTVASPLIVTYAACR